jgi:hypothetical protein
VWIRCYARSNRRQSAIVRDCKCGDRSELTVYDIRGAPIGSDCDSPQRITRTVHDVDGYQVTVSADDKRSDVLPNFGDVCGALRGGPGRASAQTATVHPTRAIDTVIEISFVPVVLPAH